MMKQQNTDLLRLLGKAVGYREWTWALGSDHVGVLAVSLTSHMTLLVTWVETLVSCAMGKEHPPAKRVIKMREKSERIKST